MKYPKRQTMIDRCVADLVESFTQSPDWAEDIFRNGFHGFAKMTDEELQTAYADAGLLEQYP